MAENLKFSDTLSEYIARIEKAEGNFKRLDDAKIITSEDLPIVLMGEPDREQIGWRLYEYQMFYVVTVSSDVPKHSHDEDVFRYVIDGELKVKVKDDERTISKGMWFVIKAENSYEIETVGYTALAGYQKLCKPTAAEG